MRTVLFVDLFSFVILNINFIAVAMVGRSEATESFLLLHCCPLFHAVIVEFIAHFVVD